jgi:hypothetical protein
LPFSNRNGPSDLISVKKAGAQLTPMELANGSKKIEKGSDDAIKDMSVVVVKVIKASER